MVAMAAVLAVVEAVTAAEATAAVQAAVGAVVKEGMAARVAVVTTATSPHLTTSIIIHKGHHLPMMTALAAGMVAVVEPAVVGMVEATTAEAEVVDMVGTTNTKSLTVYSRLSVVECYQLSAVRRKHVLDDQVIRC